LFLRRHAGVAGIHAASHPPAHRPVAGGMALAALLALAGCKVGPDFKAPTAPVAAQWTQPGEAAQASMQIQERWWTAFNDPTLDTLIDTAFRQNLSLLAAGTRVLEARAKLGIAIGEFYPQTQQLGAGLSYNQASNNDPSSSPTDALGNYWRSNWGLNVGWELDFWGRFRRGVQAADAAYLASIATYDDVLVTLLGDVASTYIGIRTLQTQLAIAQSNVVRQRMALQIARDRFAGGVATELDVFQAQNVLGQTEAAVPQYTAQLEQGKAALRVLLGMAPAPMDALLAGPPTIPVPPAAIATGIPADLLRRRPDIRSAELRAAAQSEQIGIAKADMYPAFRLSGLFGTSASNVRGNDLGDMFSASAIQFGFGLDFSWPILNYGQITNNVRVQDARLQTLLVDYQNAVLRAQREVEGSLAAFIQGGMQVAQLQRSANAALSALGIAMEQYKMGTRDFTTVLTATQNLYTAQNTLASAQGSRATALANVYRALGGGWEIRAGSDFVNGATRDQMRQRTDWGRLLPATPQPQPATTPLLPGPENRGPDIRKPEW
jgi:NodT family efflux transporter outer membrane factor (OMF) lipoprotein